MIRSISKHRIRQFATQNVTVVILRVYICMYLINVIPYDYAIMSKQLEEDRNQAVSAQK